MLGSLRHTVLGSKGFSTFRERTLERTKGRGRPWATLKCLELFLGLEPGGLGAQILQISWTLSLLECHWGAALMSLSNIGKARSQELRKQGSEREFDSYDSNHEHRCHGLNWWDLHGFRMTFMVYSFV